MSSSQSLDLKKASEFIEEFWNSSIQPSLIDYIKIPNMSRAFDPKWNENGLLTQAAEHIVAWIKNLNLSGITVEIIKHPDLSPLIFVDVPGTKETDTTLIYGHFDKQPPFEGWWEGYGPTIPVLKGDKLYGRGGADDGYSAYGALTAIKILKDQGLAHPRIVVMIEGDEESGSNHFPQYIEQLKDRIGKIGIVYCLDSGAASFDTFYNTTSLRGAIMGTLNVKVLPEGVHSGEASGIVPSSFRIARQLLDRIEDPKTGEMIPELHVEIPEDVKQGMKVFADQLGDSLLKKFNHIGHPISDDAYTLGINNGWKPYLEVTGADGLPPSSIAGNVLRPETTLKISIRMPPTADTTQASELIKKKLEENPPYGAEVSFKVVGAMGGWKAPKNQAWLDQSIQESSQKFFGKPAINLSMGGSIPLMGMLTKQFPGAQFVITGILGPETNAHGPNEFLHIPMTKKLIGSIAYIIADTYKNL